VVRYLRAEKFVGDSIGTVRAGDGNGAAPAAKLELGADGARSTAPEAATRRVAMRVAMRVALALTALALLLLVVALTMVARKDDVRVSRWECARGAAAGPLITASMAELAATAFGFCPGEVAAHRPVNSEPRCLAGGLT